MLSAIPKERGDLEVESPYCEEVAAVNGLIVVCTRGKRNVPIRRPDRHATLCRSNAHQKFALEDDYVDS